MKIKRKFPVGAEVIKSNGQAKGTHFRVWAPDHAKATVILLNSEKEKEPLHVKITREKGGYFSAFVPEAKDGSHYFLRVGNSEKWLPDPASRFQPVGPHGPSCVVDSDYPWTDSKWQGITVEGQLLYEMHIGTFTQEGTFKAAMNQLEELAELGITCLEVMPINGFPGQFGWGYDGVNLYAPYQGYGQPRDAKDFIDKAHKLGIAVILDVVYNHFGPEGNYITSFAKEYHSKKYDTEWGDAINFDLPPVREFFLANARYWVEEYHFDGLRVDATPWFFCDTEPHILAELTAVVKNANVNRSTITVGENEPQDTKLLRSYEEGGYGFDTVWNDDFHHSAHVRLTGKREAYYTDYIGNPQEFISALKYGFLYQGQYYAWQKKPRGTPHLHLKPKNTVCFLENHDQVANSGYGLRLHQKSDPGNYRALTALLLLGPNTPMLFQGQEFGSSKPFYYFADHSQDLNVVVSEGRKHDLSQFPRLATIETNQTLPNPSDPLTFTKCKLDFNERYSHAGLYKMHKDLIKLRKEDPVFKKMQESHFDGAVIGRDSFLVRYFGEDEGDRLLIINFGPDHYFNPAPEPLLVAGLHLEWYLLWSSESVAYGGEGTPPINVPYWKILGHSAIVLATKKSRKRQK